ncbi:MAG: glycosyltransferase [Acidimicrobiia bacterium]
MSAPDLVLVAPYPPPGTRHAGMSGVASYTANLAHALDQRGAAVAVLAPEDPDSPSAHHDGSIRVERPFRRGPGALMAAAHAAADLGAPVVHVQHELFLYGGPASVPGLLAGLGALRRYGPGPVVTMHQVVAADDVDRHYTRMHRVGVPAPVARHGLRAVQSAVGHMARPCIVHEEAFADAVPGAVVVPHGIERRPTPERGPSRAALGVGPHEFVVLCFGFVAPYKGLELALAAGAAAGAPVRVVVAGGEHPRLAGRDPYASDLEAAHPEARFTGWVGEADVDRWFGAADVALFPYPAPHASSGTLALALAHRAPVLLSPALVRCTAAPPALTAPASADRLARRLHQLAADPAARERLRRAGEVLARGRDWPAVADAHLAIYESVVADAHSRRQAGVPWARALTRLVAAGLPPSTGEGRGKERGPGRARPGLAGRQDVAAAEDLLRILEASPAATGPDGGQRPERTLDHTAAAGAGRAADGAR